MKTATTEPTTPKVRITQKPWNPAPRERPEFTITLNDESVADLLCQEAEKPIRNFIKFDVEAGRVVEGEVMHTQEFRWKERVRFLIPENASRKQALAALKALESYIRGRASDHLWTRPTDDVPF